MFFKHSDFFFFHKFLTGLPSTVLLPWYDFIDAKEQLIFCNALVTDYGVKNIAYILTLDARLIRFEKVCRQFTFIFLNCWLPRICLLIDLCIWWKLVTLFVITIFMAFLSMHCCLELKCRTLFYSYFANVWSVVCDMTLCPRARAKKQNLLMKNVFFWSFRMQILFVSQFHFIIRYPMLIFGRWMDVIVETNFFSCECCNLKGIMALMS